MLHDGLYLSHGPARHALVVIRQDNGNTVFIRDFETVDAALNILDEIDVIPNQKLADIREALVGKKASFRMN